MTKKIILSLSLLTFLSAPSFGGGTNDELDDLIKKGRPNGKSPHLLGHYGDISLDGKSELGKRVVASPLYTRGTTFYVKETSDRR